MLDLEKFVEYKKGINDLREEAKFRSELTKLVCAIIEDDECDAYFVESDLLIERIGIKCKKTKKCGKYMGKYTVSYYWNTADNMGYWVKLNKTNIKKIQDYINKEL